MVGCCDYERIHIWSTLMPTYDYRCKACSHNWEEFQPITSKATRKCPECGKLKAERVIGPGAGILFKGSGFYITDYRSDSYQKAAKADQPKKESKGDAKSDGSKSGGEKSTKSSSD